MILSKAHACALNQRGVLTPGLAVIILLAGIVLAIYLSQQTQIFAPKAQEYQEQTYKSDINEEPCKDGFDYCGPESSCIYPLDKDSGYCGPGKDTNCAAVITRACHIIDPCGSRDSLCKAPFYEECKDFSSSCIPFGWYKQDQPKPSQCTSDEQCKEGEYCDNLNKRNAYPPTCKPKYQNGEIISAYCRIYGTESKTANIGEVVRWQVNVEGGVRPYQISWGGEDPQLHAIGDNNLDLISLKFTTPGTKTPDVRVRSQDKGEITLKCPSMYIPTGPEPTAVPAPNRKEGDVNNDGKVDYQDFMVVVNNWGKEGQNPADLNGDGVVNFSDLIIVKQNYGK